MVRMSGERGIYVVAPFILYGKIRSKNLTRAARRLPPFAPLILVSLLQFTSALTHIDGSIVDDGGGAAHSHTPAGRSRGVPLEGVDADLVERAAFSSGSRAAAAAPPVGRPRPVSTAAPSSSTERPAPLSSLLR